jgi:hypothetical protein
LFRNEGSFEKIIIFNSFICAVILIFLYFLKFFCFSVLNNELIEINFKIYILVFINSIIVDYNILKKVFNASFWVLMMIFCQKFCWYWVLFVFINFIYFHSFKSIYNFKTKSLKKYETKQAVLFNYFSIFSKSSLKRGRINLKDETKIYINIFIESDFSKRFSFILLIFVYLFFCMYFERR